jgi:hypothetical protein
VRLQYINGPNFNFSFKVFNLHLYEQSAWKATEHTCTCLIMDTRTIICRQALIYDSKVGQGCNISFLSHEFLCIVNIGEG